MTTSLRKVDRLTGEVLLPSDLPNDEMIECPHCDQRYHLFYSNDEKDGPVKLKARATAVVSSGHPIHLLNWLPVF
jgi:hypothetical protein